MIDLDIEVCVCNSLSIKDIATCIKKNNFTTLEELLANSDCPMGDVCEACTNEGYYNDGINIPMVISMVDKGLI
ncbi:(2Fe-2S)-binding protein [Candidatus Sulfurimonas baltica]|uniref:(2Fe-2S)-binding protein n=1 Tax=Candidatus Sulfurimonas baltica TaxID=2740404 RepID=A0A7S7RLZ7_9BACT|nr:(2Fe-2S)-binding protein [Candidatus Sulfurimonas baltica]QOY51044.1 (2Fe-2S)-binding protein [Candidatus Sulfurimonas baltica]